MRLQKKSWAHYVQVILIATSSLNSFLWSLRPIDVSIKRLEACRTPRNLRIQYFMLRWLIFWNLRFISDKSFCLRHFNLNSFLRSLQRIDVCINRAWMPAELKGTSEFNISCCAHWFSQHPRFSPGGSPDEQRWRVLRTIAFCEAYDE